MNCESWPSCNSALLSFIIPNRFRFVNESGSFFREIHFAPAARRWLALPFSGAPGPSRPTNAALFSASGHGLVIIPFSRSDATALCKPGCAGLVPDLGIDFLPYVKTRRFVFPQMQPESRGKLPGTGQRRGKFLWALPQRGLAGRVRHGAEKICRRYFPLSLLPFRSML